MPDLGSFHPIVVHFAIGLLVAGALFRFLSLTRRVPFAHPAAASLLLAGALAAVLAVQSGDDAHGPVERIPGAANAVSEHEEWGERARTAFLAVAAIELAALLMFRRPAWADRARVVSAALCLPALFALYEAGEHGGELVYSYAGGVGIRSGDPEDVSRLLKAAAYHQAQADRKAGRKADAAAIVAELARRHPGDPEVQMLAAESALLDGANPEGALAVLGRVAVPTEDRRQRIRHGMLTADAHEAAGRPDAARATLQQLAAAFPDHPRVRERLQQGAPAARP